MIEERRFSKESLFGIHVYFTCIRHGKERGWAKRSAGGEKKVKRSRNFFTEVTES